MNVLLALILFYMVSGVGISLVYDEVRTYYICLTVDTILVYIYYTSVVERTDALTGLLNRKVYEQCLERLEEARVSSPNLPFVSVGYALYDPARMTVADAIGRADEEMYRVKTMYKKRREEEAGRKASVG